MKFYSEKLDRMFDSMDELLNAENQPRKNSKKTTSETSPQESTKVTKKQLVTNIENADKELEAAHTNMTAVKEQVEQLSKKYLDEVEGLLTPAKERIKTAEIEKFKAIQEFNKYYGAYQVTYTGDKAAKEFSRARNLQGSLFDLFGTGDLFKYIFEI